ncbi:MAG: LamG domain-containing protein [Pirellulaceae bacterium]|nr:LamG domain-containing protein [Pirellulaceae bacterium]
MSREKVLLFLVLAVVLTTAVSSVARAETLGCYYADAVAALDPPIYLRLSEASGVALGTAVVNDGTLGASLGMIWGTQQTNGVLYANSEPNSGISSVNPDVMIGGKNCIGLENGNTGAQIIPYAINASNSMGFNVWDNPNDPIDKVAALDEENETYSLFFKTKDNNQNPRMITSHPGNSNRFDLVMTYGKFCVATAAANTTNWLADSTVAFNDGLWHHLVVIRNGDDAANAQLYVDGQQIALTATSSTPSYMTLGTSPQAGSTDAGYGLRIGTHGNKNRGWNGYLDEIAMWGRALTPEEAGGLYQAAVSVPEPSSLALLLAMFFGGLAVSRRVS